MKPSLRRAVATVVLGVCAVCLPCAAQPRTPVGRVRATPSRPVPVLGSAPLVAVQLAGLRPGEGRSWAAMMHALRRDALPWLEVCASALGQPRAMVRVELVHHTGARWAVGSVESGRRHAALEACVRRAAERVAVPASELTEPAPGAEATAEPPITFDVAFGMPRFGAPSRR